MPYIILIAEKDYISMRFFHCIAKIQRIPFILFVSYDIPFV